MSQQTARELPRDHAAPRTDRHAATAIQMRETDDWVHIGNYNARRTAHNIAHMVRTSKLAAYRGHLYDARTITTATGTHQVWGQWIGPRGVKRR